MPFYYVTAQPGVNLDPYVKHHVECFGEAIYSGDLRRTTCACRGWNRGTGSEPASRERQRPECSRCAHSGLVSRQHFADRLPPRHQLERPVQPVVQLQVGGMPRQW